MTELSLAQELPGIFVIILLVLANGFFVAAEFAIVRSHPVKFKGDDEKRFGSKSALWLMENLELSLSSTQLGITVASLLLGWYAQGTLENLFLAILLQFGVDLAGKIATTSSTIFAIGIAIYLHVVIGELVAKSLAVRYPEETLRVLATPTVWFTKFCRPLIFLLQASASALLSAVGLSRVATMEKAHSSLELAGLISQSSDQGVLDEEEKEMLHGIIGFSETIAREVMTPRTALITVSKDASFDEVVDAIVKSGFSRLPVTGESVDHILGIVLSKDVLAESARVKRTGEPFDLRRVMREPYFIPGTKPIDSLLREFKSRKIHIAIVLDEHGGVDGVVTLEDLLEEIVGDIFDESDTLERDIVVEESGDILVDGGVLVADINEQFGLSIPEGDYDTVGGFVFSVLGRVPEVGDEIRLTSNGIPLVNGSSDEIPPASEAGDEGIDFDEPSSLIKVEKVDGNRVERLRIKEVSTDESPPSASSSTPTSRSEAA